MRPVRVRPLHARARAYRRGDLRAAGLPVALHRCRGEGEPAPRPGAEQARDQARVRGQELRLVPRGAVAEDAPAAHDHRELCRLGRVGSCRLRVSGDQLDLHGADEAAHRHLVGSGAQPPPLRRHLEAADPHGEAQVCLRDGQGQEPIDADQVPADALSEGRLPQVRPGEPGF